MRRSLNVIDRLVCSAVGDGFIAHYNGTEWKKQVDETSGDLWQTYYSIWGTAGNNVLAVSNNCGTGQSIPAGARYDGDTWSWDQSYELSEGQLWVVWGFGSDEIYAGLLSGACETINNTFVVYDGGVGVRGRPPRRIIAGPLVGGWVLDIHAAGPNDLYAVANDGGTMVAL
ncbi:MAG: hypothetical protein IID05_11375 [Gemmatimonadetes bacterium]|nr:hypothetical protein [Gemmatimonadota bacterium]